MRRRRTSSSAPQGRQSPRQRRGKRIFTARHPNRQRSSASVSALEKELLSHMHQNLYPLSLHALQQGLALRDNQMKQLKEVLSKLCHRQVITCSRKKLYELQTSSNIKEGVVEMNPRGFGFAILDEQGPGSKRTEEKNDPFISPSHLASANHGDRVLFEIIKTGRKRAEAKVLHIIKRAVSSVIGIFTAGRDTGMVSPEDERFTYSILIQRKDFLGAKNGNAVIAEITEFQDGQTNPRGRISQVLGDPEDINVQTMMVAAKFHLPFQFEEKTLRFAEQLSGKISPDSSRKELLDIVHVTIDGEDARDFDDAVAIEKIGKGFRLYVSIADVAHYVQPGDPLDIEAYQRGTSVYFPTKVLPMLPERLSNDLCSLVPGKQRPTFTAVLEFDAKGKRQGKHFFKSTIKSRYRLTYTEVKRILVDKDEQLRRKYKLVTTSLEWMAKLAAALEKNRIKRGSIGFSLPEAKLKIDEQGQVEAVERAERNLAHKIIEEFMLAANEAVAETFTEKKKPALYRIHEKPDAVKVADFTRFAATLGLGLPKNGGTPEWFGKILVSVAGTPREYIVNNLLLRTMQRARYSPDNVGHFGLAASDYTHFTSPIRRYPDLLVHRVLAEVIDPKKTAAGQPKDSSLQALTVDGDFLSGRERTATEAEWEMIDRLKVRFMAGKIGESFNGVVSGVTDFGLFIELLEWFISGAVAMTDLNDDHYIFDEKNHRLTGRHTGKIFQIGDLLRVTLKSVEIKQRRINFVIEQDGRGRNDNQANG